MGIFENTEWFGPEWFGMAALVIFFLFFVSVLVWVFRPGSKEKYSAWGNIPLDGDQPVGADLSERPVGEERVI